MTKSSRPELYPIPIALLGRCGLCRVSGLHNHFDRVLKELVCVGCWDDLMGAQRLGAFMLERPLGLDDLRFRIWFFDHAGGRTAFRRAT